MRHLCAAVALLIALAGCTSDVGPAGPPSAASSSAKQSENPPQSARGVHLTDVERSRTEVWRDVQLEVPTGWKLGYGPMVERGRTLLCGIGRGERTDVAYVGRPGYGSDVCLIVDRDEVMLTGPGVWFGSPLAEGDMMSKNGLEQTTVAVGGSRVTVASYDSAVREHVLESIEQVSSDAHGCPPRPALDRSHPFEGYGDPLSLAVCVYRRDRPSHQWQRFWTTSLSAARARQVVDAVAAAEPAEKCLGDRAGQLVLLRVTTDDRFGEDPLLRDLVVRPSSCRSVQEWWADGPRWLGLEPEIVRPWAVDGVSTYVYSNGLPRSLDRFFRPLWG